MSTVTLTGHRPPKAGLTWSHKAPADLYWTQRLVEAIEYYYQWSDGPLDSVITGGAQGWDTLGARAAYLTGTPYHVFVPFEGQQSKWPEEARDRYRTMLSMAKSVIYVNRGPYAAWKMIKRNEAMVNHAFEVWALWDGSDGGTKHCIDYADKIGIPVVNFYEG